MKEITLFGSSIAGLIGRNPYTTFAEEFEKLFKKHDKTLFGEIQNSQESKKKQVFEEHNQFIRNVQQASYRSTCISDVAKGHELVSGTTKDLLDQAETKVKQLESENKVVHQKADLVIQQKVLQDAELAKEVAQASSVEEKLEILQARGVQDDDIITVQLEIQESRDKVKESESSMEKMTMLHQGAISMVNTRFGITHENNTLQVFQDRYKLPVTTPKKIFKRVLYEDPQLRVVLAGKVDGLIEEPCVNEKPCLVEIKNRVKGFFKNLVDYEKVQIMTYMFICEMEQCYLIQTVKGSNDTNIDVNLYPFDNSWFHTFTNDVVKFGKAYVSFVTDPRNIRAYNECQTTKEKTILLKSLGF
jgi:hypothetical protein